MKKKMWTEKQIKEKMQDIQGKINYNKKRIHELEEEMRDLEVLLKYYQDKLAEKHNNPSSIKFGAVS